MNISKQQQICPICSGTMSYLNPNKEECYSYFHKDSETLLKCWDCGYEDMKIRGIDYDNCK